MRLFQCDSCGTVDAVELAYPDLNVPPLSLTELKCSKCLSGTWHGQFAQERFDPEKDVVINRAQGLGFS